MFFKRIYLGCLAQASYLIGDGGEAVVIDPMRDVQQYLDEAKAQGLTIRHVIETHAHADFVSGHVELAKATGAKIWMGPAARTGFDFEKAADGTEIRVGNLRLRFLETPGHTPESVTILLFEGDAAEPTKMFTGDTLFLGDVGRPDLVAAKGLTAQQMAGFLYDSLQHKILPLPDSVEVWPGHGAGSACGKNICNSEMTTLGEQKRTNLMLQPMDKETFIAKAASDLAPPPAYFGHDASLNLKGAPALGEWKPLPRFSAADMERALLSGAVVVDVRNRESYGRGHLAGSINIGLDGNFAPWAGALLAVDRPLVLVADTDNQVDEARVRLARVGFENVLGAMSDGLAAWKAAGGRTRNLPQVEVGDLHERLAAGWPGVQVLDVRKGGEYTGGHVPGAVHHVLDDLRKAPPALDPARPTVVVCGSGYRSSAAAGFLEAAGFTELYNVTGGTSAWRGAGFACEN